MGAPQIVAVATRITAGEVAVLDAFEHGANRAERARVLLRFALEHLDDVRGWYAATDGQPEHQPTP